MESVTGESKFLRAVRRLALVGVVAVGILGCATSGTSTNSYKLVLNAPGLETVQPKVVVIQEEYNKIVERSTWNANDTTWPQANLVFWRIKDMFRNRRVYVYQSSLPEQVRNFLPGEWITLSAGGKSENVLGDLDYQRFRWKFDIECIFIRQGVSRFSDQVEVSIHGVPIGDMVIQGWYCVGPAEPNQDTAFQGFINGIGIQGWALP